MALACWWGELVGVAKIDEEDDTPFDACSPEGLQAEIDQQRRRRRHRPGGGTAPESLDWF
jgi:hypothetical protein